MLEVISTLAFQLFCERFRALTSAKNSKCTMHSWVAVPLSFSFITKSATITSLSDLFFTVDLAAYMTTTPSAREVTRLPLSRIWLTIGLYIQLTRPCCLLLGIHTDHQQKVAPVNYPGDRHRTAFWDFYPTHCHNGSTYLEGSTGFDTNTIQRIKTHYQIIKHQQINITGRIDRSTDQ